MKKRKKGRRFTISTDRKAQELGASEMEPTQTVERMSDEERRRKNERPHSSLKLMMRLGNSTTANRIECLEKNCYLVSPTRVGIAPSE